MRILNAAKVLSRASEGKDKNLQPDCSFFVLSISDSTFFSRKTDLLENEKDELFVFLDCIFVVYATNSYGIGAKN